MKLSIIYEDDDYIIINKPSGVLSIPDRHNAELPSVTKVLRDKYASIFIVHRIDKETSGCICFAKNEEAHKYASMLFEKRLIEKKYLGIVHGSFDQASGIIEDAIMEHPVIKGKMIINQKQGKPSTTVYETIANYGTYSLVSFHILTGRTHQIRIHSANLGHPIVCDALYGLTNPVYISSLKKKYKMSKDILEETPILNRLALHAFSLKFTTAKGKQIVAEAPLSKDMDAMLKQCNKWLKQ
ncbi:MAG: RluA family pseudouridine synthase [Bacteroidetes bacterium]|nr:RluA family pseudouridine synthase [Bacteroidota bacterium]HQW46005.1 RluA family pseudouridine synthase [Chitinophagaceae bacterium]MBK6818629.1 RluA family pseudouridine synthase [Bacteroidota bacterium]MBK7586982.1 RluA family pseudouridine synthase [Bacteroidota bacterium]MBK9299970.1 RluA family pseudouridine synthase [Bacteroidota bacterium]